MASSIFTASTTESERTFRHSPRQSSFSSVGGGSGSGSGVESGADEEYDSSSVSPGLGGSNNVVGDSSSGSGSGLKSVLKSASSSSRMNKSIDGLPSTSSSRNDYDEGNGGGGAGAGAAGHRRTASSPSPSESSTAVPLHRHSQSNLEEVRSPPETENTTSHDIILSQTGSKGRVGGGGDGKRGSKSLKRDNNRDTTVIDGSVLEFMSSNEVVRRVAFPSRLLQMKPVAGGSWSFCKTFGDGDWMAAGQVQIPPNGEKGLKSVRDNSYVFCVMEGAVKAKIHQTSYTLSQGGMFMVPRGNAYSITNLSSERAAKLVFFQARKTYTPNELDGDDPLTLTVNNDPTNNPFATLGFQSSKAIVLLGWLFERGSKLSVKYKKLFMEWYLRASFNAARYMTVRRYYFLFFLLGFLFRRLPFSPHSRINVQFIKVIRQRQR